MLNETVKWKMCNRVYCLPILITALFTIAVAFQDTIDNKLVEILNNVTANCNEFVDGKVKYLTDSQVKAIEQVGVRLAAYDIDRMKYQSAWDILDETNLKGGDHQLAYDQLVKHMLNNNCIYCSFTNLLQFVNATSNIDRKVNGYRTLFNEIVSNAKLSNSTKNWLNLQFVVSHDVADPQLQILLNTIESNLNNVLNSLDLPNYSHHIPQSYCYCPEDDLYVVPYSPGNHHLHYFVQQLCSFDIPNLERAFRIILSRMNGVIELLPTCLTELQRTNRLNYTMYILTDIQEKLQADIPDQTACQQRTELIQKFPANSIFRKLFSRNPEFYIRNAYSNEYLYHSGETVQQVPYYKGKERVHTTPMKQSIWKIKGTATFWPIKIVNEKNSALTIGKCNIHDELYLFVNERPEYDEHFEWDLEIDDIFSDRYRIRMHSTGEYLGVDDCNNIAVSSNYNGTNSSKMDWIFESLPNQTDIEQENEKMCETMRSKLNMHHYVDVNFIDTVKTEQHIYSTDDYVANVSQSQLDAIKDVVFRQAVIEISKNKIQATWDLLNETSLTCDEPPLELIIKFMLNNCFYDSFNKLLQFVNASSLNANWKAVGYEALFNEMISNSNLSRSATNWIHLQYIVSHDVCAPKLQILLKEIESKFTSQIHSPDSVYFAYRHADDDCKKRDKPTRDSFIEDNFLYLVKRFCSTDVANIAKAYELIFRTYKYEFNVRDNKITESILSCVTELERNNRLNYTILFLPSIRLRLQTMLSNYKLRKIDQKQCQMLYQLIQILPTNSSIKKLLSQNHEFYIRNAFSKEYLYYGNETINYLSSVGTNVTEKLTWKIENYSTRYHFLTILKNRFNILVAKANDKMPGNYDLVLDERRFPDPWRWTLETDDIYADRFRIMFDSLKKYLSVGESSNSLVLLSNNNNDEDTQDASKMEWIFESVSNQVEDIGNEVKQMCEYTERK